MSGDDLVKATARVGQVLYQHREAAPTDEIVVAVHCRACGMVAKREHLDLDQDRVKLWVHQGQAVVSALLELGWVSPSELKAQIAQTVREVVGLATNHEDPDSYMEWTQLVLSVGEGHYTPPAEREVRA